MFWVFNKDSQFLLWELKSFSQSCMSSGKFSAHSSWEIVFCPAPWCFSQYIHRFIIQPKIKGKLMQISGVISLTSPLPLSVLCSTNSCHLGRPPWVPNSVQQDCIINSTRLQVLTEFPLTMLRSRNYLQTESQGDCRTHFLCSVFLRDHSPVLPVAQCLKTLFHIFLSSFELFMGYMRQKGTCFIPVTPLWTTVGVSKPFNTESLKGQTLW